MLHLLFLLVFGQYLDTHFPMDSLNWNDPVKKVQEYLWRSGSEFTAEQTECAVYVIRSERLSPRGKKDSVIYHFYNGTTKLVVDNPIHKHLSGLFQVEWKYLTDSSNETSYDKKLVIDYATRLHMFSEIGQEILTRCKPTDLGTNYRNCIEKENTVWSIYTRTGEKMLIAVPNKSDAIHFPTRLIFRQAANFLNFDLARSCRD